jgi:hypothetical protein
MGRAGKRGRLGAAALLFMLCLGPLLTAAHELANRHRFCLEHQTIEEDAEGGEGSVAHPGEETPKVDGAASESLAGHVGCPLAQALAQRATVGQTPVASTLSRASESDPAAPVPSVRRPLAVLTVAPKTSPPLVA